MPTAAQALFATVKPGFELRYQHGSRNLLPADPGEVNQQTLSFLVSIIYGGASATGRQQATPGVLYSGHDDRASKTPSTRSGISVPVVMGNPGDRWLDTMQFTRIARATRDGKYGYEVTYDIAGHGEMMLFWPRDHIDFDRRGRDSLWGTMQLREGSLRYPRRLTSKTLPQVHRGILPLEADHGKDADGYISGMKGFEIVSALALLKLPCAQPAKPLPGPRLLEPRKEP